MNQSERLARRRNYYEENKESINKKNREYYHKNKTYLNTNVKSYIKKQRDNHSLVNIARWSLLGRNIKEYILFSKSDYEYIKKNLT